MPVVSKGLEGIVATTTDLSDVDGLNGRLTYVGYDINELAGKVSFEETIHLLWHGRLPTRSELAELHHELAEERELPKGVFDFISTAPKTASPMDVLRTAISMLGLYDSAPAEETRVPAERKKALSITSKMGVVVALFHRARTGRPLPVLRPDLGEAAHFLYLINGTEASPEAVRTLDCAYVLHADHGMNASTFSARVAISTLTDIFSAISSAIGTLKGPLHGGANEGVIHMLEEIGSEENVIPWLEETLAQKKKIMGIGHRVYKVLDPRAPHLQRMASELSAQIGEPKWLRMSEKIVAYMKQHKGLNANVDFYSATVYYSLGIPTDLFTPIFAIARCAGWTAHVLEQLADNRLYRPLSEYTGPATGKRVIPLDER